jgi:hypothetical protein
MRQIAAPQRVFRAANPGFSRQIQEYIDTLPTNDNNSHCDLSRGGTATFEWFS